MVAEEVRGMGLGDFVAWLTPAFRRGGHLGKWCELIERADREPGLRAMCSVPVRHWKTWTTVHGIVWLLLRDPSRRIVFLTHSFDAAEKWAKEIRKLAEALDHRLGANESIGPTRGWNKIAEWRNTSDGGVVVMSADQSKIGYDVHVLVVDDPIDEMGAKEPAKREEVDTNISFYTGRCVRQTKDGGVRGPVLIVASRFHPDDPIGRRLTRSAVQWEYVHHAAITVDDAGEHAFAPEVMSLETLHAIRAELAESDPAEYVWFAQFQNDPRAASDQLFKAKMTFDTYPEGHGYQTWIGIDFAYSAAKDADYIAVVAGRRYGSAMYIAHAERQKLDLSIGLDMIARARKALGDPNAPVWSYIAGPEKGGIEYYASEGVMVQGLGARFSKRTRAQKTIDRWNDGGIYVKSSGGWVSGFLRRIGLYAGLETDDDDEIDALVSAHDGMMGAASGVTWKGGTRRM
jgi:hypothetical protein